VIDFDVGKAFNALLQTLPFVLLRIAVYAAIAVAYALSVGIGAGIGAAVSLFLTGPGAGAIWGAIFGFGVVSAVLYWAREYMLYLVKGAHIAVLVEVLDGQPLPQGRGQIEHGRRVIQERFATTSVLFAVDVLIRAVLRALNRTMFTLAAFVPIPALRSLVAIFSRVVNLSLTYTDEIILAHNIRTRSSNPWETSREALILYAQNYKTILRNAVFLLLVMWALSVAVFIVLLAPAAAVAAIFPNAIGGIAVVIALVCAWAVKAALLEPFAIAAMMQVYFKVIDGQVPDPAWDERLSKVSRQFVQLKDRARGHSDAAPADVAQPA
jgi:hypothetical protein